MTDLCLAVQWLPGTGETDLAAIVRKFEKAEAGRLCWYLVGVVEGDEFVPPDWLDYEPSADAAEAVLALDRGRKLRPDLIWQVAQLPATDERVSTLLDAAAGHPAE